MDFGSEKIFQDEIKNNTSLQKDICLSLNIDFKKIEFIKEDKLINGIVSDFTLIYKNKVKAIMECKGGNINVTDYVRGIGQIFQYEHFAQNSLSSKGYNFFEIDEFYSIYCFPDSVLRLNDFNIGLFKYPKTKKIIEINSSNLAVRLIDEKELANLAQSKLQNTKIISQYYIRDNRIFEIYFLLKVLMIFKIKNKTANRKIIEEKILKKTQTINNNNWRNAFISLSSLGLIDSTNFPTEVGMKFAGLDFCEFAYMIFDAYIKPYYQLIFEVLNKNNNLSNYEISENIKNILCTKKDILFLTQSKGRYISSWLNIARDDFGMIDFLPKSRERNIYFDPFLLNKETFLQHIKTNSIYYKKYKNIFDKVLYEI